MNTITGNLEEVTNTLQSLGFPATNLPAARTFSITWKGMSADVVRTDISEYANIDLDLADASGSVLWMVEGVDPGDVDDIKEYLDNYLIVMANNDENENSPLMTLAQAQIEETFDYRNALAALTAWKNGK